MRREGGARPEVASAACRRQRSSSLHQTPHDETDNQLFYTHTRARSGVDLNALHGGTTNSSPPVHQVRQQGCRGTASGDEQIRTRSFATQEQELLPIAKVLH